MPLVPISPQTSQDQPTPSCASSDPNFHRTLLNYAQLLAEIRHQALLLRIVWIITDLHQEEVIELSCSLPTGKSAFGNALAQLQDSRGGKAALFIMGAFTVCYGLFCTLNIYARIFPTPPPVSLSLGAKPHTFTNTLLPPREGLSRLSNMQPQHLTPC